MMTSSSITWFVRVSYVIVGVGTCIWRDALQGHVDSSWEYLKSSWVFNCAYFETWWATLSYVLVLGYPYIFSKLPISRPYRIDPTLVWQGAGIRRIVVEAVVYCTPLMTLDTFMVKKYPNVDRELILRQRQSWIHHNRLLPVEPPPVFQIIWHVVASLIIYDAIFYLIHLTLHKNLWLYKKVHADHHEHGLLHSRVTNQLTVSERIMLILAANESLKLVHAHPLTRTIFVPIFIGWLVENHCGYDVPWTLDKVIPFGLVSGSRAHYDHHMKGTRNYQPFFTHIDRFVNRKIKSAE